VNCANRMESNSAPGRVTASPAAAALLRQQAPSAVLLSRGVVPIKGKGPMELFWLMQVAPLVQPRGSTPAANSRAAASRGGNSTGGARISG
jgi:class 3 adenylate cyclase